MTLRDNIVVAAILFLIIMLLIAFFNLYKILAFIHDIVMLLIEMTEEMFKKTIN